jgi:hypothetical protein
MTTLATFALASQRDQGGGSDGLMVGPQSLPPLQPRNTRKVGLSVPAQWRVMRVTKRASALLDDPASPYANRQKRRDGPNRMPSFNRSYPQPRRTT